MTAGLRVLPCSHDKRSKYIESECPSAKAAIEIEENYYIKTMHTPLTSKLIVSIILKMCHRVGAEHLIELFV